MPIFVGLWQALNTSFPLRHAPFLWIRDLAAPDMLFHHSVRDSVCTFLGHWFNVLPFVVVGLMLFQTKLFAPPATTPEAEKQQKMMKYMMIFMGFMFYKVPSGLGIYFITSSLWAIGERLLLPKITHASGTETPARPGRAKRASFDGGAAAQRRPRRLARGQGQRRGQRGETKPPGAIAQFWGACSKKPAKTRLTARLSTIATAKDRDKDRERDRDRPGPSRGGGKRQVAAERRSWRHADQMAHRPAANSTLALDPNDTIAAIASPPGPGLRGSCASRARRRSRSHSRTLMPSDRPRSLPPLPRLAPGSLKSPACGRSCR